jgi:hypothetical protein
MAGPAGPLRWAWPFAAVVALWAAVGFAGSAAISGPRVDFGVWLATKWWPVVPVLGAASVLYLALHRHRTPGRVPARHQAGPPGNLRSLRVVAEEALEDIEFQQKRTSGWSGKVGLPVGAEAGVTGSREVTRQPRTYPQIVHEFSDFLRATIRSVSALGDIATPSVVVILDELDKIVSPDEAQDFVNEVKALFNLDVPGFLFLVSVSEDALASFEPRGLPVRDAFDSAFDVIFRLEYLKLVDARQVLTSRILGLPEPFVCLCHCMAGACPGS